MEKSRGYRIYSLSLNIDSGFIRWTDCLNLLSKWATALSVETGGTQRVTEDERREMSTHIWAACTFWLSANMAVATLSTGMIGPNLGLGFWDSFAIILVANVLACMLPAWSGSFGLTGLRMTTFSRYSFGYWGNLLVVAFSMLSTTGWNAVNSISGASCLAAVSSGTVPAWAGVIIITTTVWLICVLGITWIHRLNTFLWLFPAIVWCVAAGTGAHSFETAAHHTPSGANGAASVLSFLAVVFSFAGSWINCAADYNIRMPLDTQQSHIFLLTYIGIAVPAILVQTLGAALMSQSSPSWVLVYQTYGVGGPLAKVLEPAGGFGKLLMVIAALSSIPNNIPNNYSFALHAQNFGPWAARVPRIVFVTLGFVASIIVGCIASLSFESSLQTVLSIVGYWTVIHIVIVAEEHIIFRRSRWSEYNLDAWDDATLLPFGWGAIITFVLGFLGAVLGMKVTWYTAPLASLIGTKGANIGHELTFVCSAIAFPIFRWMERRWTGK